MTTMNKTLIKNHVMLEQTPSDIDEQYPSFWAFVAGLLHLLCGLFSIALGIGSICTQATGYFIGYGIWCGFLFLLSGCAVLITGFKQCARTWAVLMSLIFGLLASAAALVQFSIGIVAAANDNGGSLQNGRLTSLVTTHIPRYDVFYIRQGVTNICAGSGFTWATSWGPVDVLLIIVALFEAVVAIATGVIGCRSMCYGHVDMVQQVGDNDIQPPLMTPRSSQEPGFFNAGFNQ